MRTPAKETGANRTTMNSVNLMQSAENEAKMAASQATEQSALQKRSSVKPQLHFLQQKAGMEGIDAAEIARRVYEASKDSDHYKK